MRRDTVHTHRASVPRPAHGAAADGKGDQLLAPMASAVFGAADTTRSFADAFAEVHADCVRLAWHLTSSREDAEDIAADVLATTWERYEIGRAHV